MTRNAIDTAAFLALVAALAIGFPELIAILGLLALIGAAVHCLAHLPGLFGADDREDR